MPVIEFIPRKVTLDDPPILPPLDIICKPEILPDKALNAFVGLVSKASPDTPCTAYPKAFFSLGIFNDVTTTSSNSVVFSLSTTSIEAPERTCTSCVSKPRKEKTSLSFFPTDME